MDFEESEEIDAIQIGRDFIKLTSILIEKHNKLANELIEERDRLNERCKLLERQLEQKQGLLEQMAQECDLMRSQLHKVNKYELMDVIAHEGVIAQIFCNGNLFSLKIHCEEEG